MIPIILSDGNKIEVENESSANDFVVLAYSFSEVDKLLNDVFTEENINGAVMEGETLSNLIFNGISAEYNNIGVTVHFFFRYKTVEERVSEIEEDDRKSSNSRIEALEKTVKELSEKIEKMTKEK